MMHALGFKHALSLLLLISICAALYFLGFHYFKPQAFALDKELKNTRSDISRLRGEIQNATNDLEEFKGQKEEFKKLKAYDFFDTQDRVQMSRRLDELREESTIIYANYDISPAKVVENDSAQGVGFKVLKTDVSMTLNAFEDNDIYKFIYLLNYGFPGHVSIESLSMEKTKKVTRSLIQVIGNGEPVTIVQADLNFRVITMIEDENFDKKVRGTQ